MPKRRACDRCYRYKEKCSFNDGAETCTLCDRSASTCTTLRLQHRQGRRPQVKGLGPKASVQIWDIESTPSGISTCRSFIETRVQQSSPAASRSRDATHFSTFKLPTPSPYMYQTAIVERPFEQPFDDFTPGVFDNFYAAYDVFMLGPSFAQTFRGALQHSYACSPILLHDMYKVISIAVKCARENKGLRDRDVAKGTRSLQKLRTTRISGIHDAFAILALGQALAAFDLLTSCIGLTSILRYSLTSIQPWYGQLSRDPSLDSITISSILWHTLCCLVRREVPVIKFIPRDSHIVDHLAGLCTTLLPILYDLCLASYGLKCQLRSGSQTDTNPLRQVQQRLLSWVPEPPSTFALDFSNQEILGMQAQASMYRAAGLLIAHRILNPIGTLDDIAGAYANSILLEFSKYSASSGPGTRLQFVTFPGFMATLEIPDAWKEIRKTIPLLSVAPACRAKMSAFVKFVWMKRNCGSTSFMFDLVDEGPDFLVIP